MRAAAWFALAIVAYVAAALSAPCGASANASANATSGDGDVFGPIGSGGNETGTGAANTTAAAPSPSAGTTTAAASTSTAGGATSTAPATTAATTTALPPVPTTTTASSAAPGSTAASSSSAAATTSTTVTTTPPEPYRFSFRVEEACAWIETPGKEAAFEQTLRTALVDAYAGVTVDGALNALLVPDALALNCTVAGRGRRRRQASEQGAVEGTGTFAGSVTEDEAQGVVASLRGVSEAQGIVFRHGGQELSVTRVQLDLPADEFGSLDPGPSTAAAPTTARNASNTTAVPKTASPAPAPQLPGGGVSSSASGDDGDAGLAIGLALVFVALLVLLAVIVYFYVLKQKCTKLTSIYQYWQHGSHKHMGEDVERPEVPMIRQQSMRDMLRTVQETKFPEQCMATPPLHVGSMVTTDARIASVYLHNMKQAMVVRLQELTVQMEHMGYTASFRQLCTVGAGQPHLASQRDCNQLKNRYANIIPYDHSRVLLPVINDDPDTDYINANWVDGYDRQHAYIAAQGPVPNSFISFWRMIWHHNIEVIVMTTKEIENGRMKCHRYWPQHADGRPGAAQTYGQAITVKHTSTRHYDLWIVREFELSLTGWTRKITHIAYTAWPDFGVPKTPTDLLMFRQAVRALITDPSVPLVIHCSAGVGRTGTFIGVDRALTQVLAMGGKINIDAVITNMRNTRCHMVQTEQQYLCVHHTVVAGIDWLLHNFKANKPAQDTSPQDSYGDEEAIYDNHQVAMMGIAPRSIALPALQDGGDGDGDGDGTRHEGGGGGGLLAPPGSARPFSNLEPLAEEPATPTAALHSRGGSGTAVFPGFKMEENVVRLQSVRRENPLYTQPVAADVATEHAGAVAVAAGAGSTATVDSLASVRMVPETQAVAAPQVIQLRAESVEVGAPHVDAEAGAGAGGRGTGTVGSIASVKERKETMWSVPGEDVATAATATAAASLQCGGSQATAAVATSAALDAPGAGAGAAGVHAPSSPKMTRAARRAAMDEKLKKMEGEGQPQSVDAAVDAIRRAAGSPRESCEVGGPQEVPGTRDSALVAQTEMWPPPKAKKPAAGAGGDAATAADTSTPAVDTRAAPSIAVGGDGGDDGVEDTRLFKRSPVPPTFSEADGSPLGADGLNVSTSSQRTNSYSEATTPSGRRASVGSLSGLDAMTADDANTMEASHMAVRKESWTATNVDLWAPSPSVRPTGGPSALKQQIQNEVAAEKAKAEAQGEGDDGGKQWTTTNVDLWAPSPSIRLNANENKDTDWASTAAEI